MTAVSLKSDPFQNAVLGIERRAERQLIDEVLVRYFVPNRVLDELDNSSNQLLFGRRGVGKTHTLKVLLSRMAQRGVLCHYLDCTSFGSGLASDGSPKNTAVRFFSQFVTVLTNQLLDDAIIAEAPPKGLDSRLLESLVKISNAATPRSPGDTFNFVGIVEYFIEFMSLLLSPS